MDIFRGFAIKEFSTERGPTPDGRYQIVIKTRQFHGTVIETIKCDTRDEALERMSDLGYVMCEP